MVTGDNLLTGIAVSRDCSLLAPNDPVYIVNIDDTVKSSPTMKLIKEGKTGDVIIEPAIEQMSRDQSNQLSRDQIQVDTERQNIIIGEGERCLYDSQL